MRLMFDTAAEAMGRTDGFCVCGCGRKASTWHHIFPQSKWPELGDTAENIVGVYFECHEHHHNASKRLPRSAVAPAESLATTEAMKSYLERVYRG